jgi:alpha-soluble NSF attachment protein
MASAAASKKGDEYMAEADKALKKKSIFGAFLSKSAKYEEASEFFVKAGNSYKLANQWQSAGEAFTLAARNTLLTDMPGDAVNYFVEAGNAFKKINPNDAVNSFNEAITLYNDNGRFAMSARYYKEVAEIYESDKNFPAAIENYQSAADLYSGDNKQTTANQCLLKIALLAAEAADYHKASEIFEKIGRESMESNLGKFSAKGYLFQSLLCYLAAGDTVAVRNKLEAYKTVDYSFGSSRECAFIEKLADVSRLSVGIVLLTT